MTRNIEAAELAGKYRTVTSRSAAKEWRKWSHVPSSARPFDATDLDQWALEAILIMGGLVAAGRKLQTLAECEAQANGDAWIQRNVDLYVKDKAAKAYRASKVKGRAADVYLDEPLSADIPGTKGDLILSGNYGTNPDSLHNPRESFPILYSQYIQGEKQSDTMRRMGIGSKTFLARRAVEMTRFHAWAVANRRVVPGTGVPAKRGSGSRSAVRAV